MIFNRFSSQNFSRLGLTVNYSRQREAHCAFKLHNFASFVATHSAGKLRRRIQLTEEARPENQITVWAQVTERNYLTISKCSSAVPNQATSTVLTAIRTCTANCANYYAFRNLTNAYAATRQVDNESDGSRIDKPNVIKCEQSLIYSEIIVCTLALKTFKHSLLCEQN